MDRSSRQWYFPM